MFLAKMSPVHNHSKSLQLFELLAVCGFVAHCASMRTQNGTSITTRVFLRQVDKFIQNILGSPVIFLNI